MHKNFDVIVIGGGATGLGIAVEAATRGYQTLLLEAHDYGKGTSSKSTKLVHGGIRYLANFDIALVKEGLEERFYFLNNAPHLAKKQTYLIPFYNYFDKLKYFIGIKLYDYLSGRKKIGRSYFLSKQSTYTQVPRLKTEKLISSAVYYDGNFDDSRMLITLLRTLEANGGIALNYHQVTDFIVENTKICGVQVLDKLQHVSKQFFAKVVVNATGTLTDVLLNQAEPAQRHHAVSAAQGTHLVFDKAIFDSMHCLVIPKTSDGRILFVSPWHDKIIVGTTDIAVDNASIEPKARAEEIDFILETLNRYAKKTVTKADIKSVFCGQRPLVSDPKQQSTGKVSRKHQLLETANGLISMVGGKWTIYRRMGEDTIDYAVAKNYLPPSKSVTRDFKLFACPTTVDHNWLGVYGTEKQQILDLQKQLNNTAKIHPDLPYLQAEVIYHVRYEQAKTVEDVLARRTHAVLLDAEAAQQSALIVAQLMAKELGKPQVWIDEQLKQFSVFLEGYMLTQNDAGGGNNASGG